MKLKTLLPGLALIVLMTQPIVASAAVSFDLTPAGVTIHIGDRDHRGYFWDGYDWRTPTWWQAHRGRHIGEQGPRGYWNGNGWQPHRPEAHQQPERRKPVTRHQQPEHQRPTAHHAEHNNHQLTADHQSHGAAGHRPDFQPHG